MLGHFISAILLELLYSCCENQFLFGLVFEFELLISLLLPLQ